LHYIGIELCDPPRYDELTDTIFFVKVFSLQVLEQQRLLALYVFLKETLARWWAAHKQGMKYWSQCRRLMKIRFGTKVEKIAQNYTCESDLAGDVE